MKITVEECDRQAAIRDKAKDKDIAECCPVYQALKRHGVRVRVVGVSFFRETDRSGEIALPPIAQNITIKFSRQWPDLKLPVSFNLELP